MATMNGMKIVLAKKWVPEEGIHSPPMLYQRNLSVNFNLAARCGPCDSHCEPTAEDFPIYQTDQRRKCWRGGRVGALSGTLMVPGADSPF